MKSGEETLGNECSVNSWCPRAARGLAAELAPTRARFSGAGSAERACAEGLVAEGRQLIRGVLHPLVFSQLISMATLFFLKLQVLGNMWSC